MARVPTKKSLSEIQVEEAHGGAGKRQMIFHKSEPFVSSQFEAMTKGFLPPGVSYDWHQHDEVDEFFLVVAGEGEIEYTDGRKFSYKADDVFYSPAGISHRLSNTGTNDNIFYFVRINA